jgi:hypothetical protein
VSDSIQMHYLGCKYYFLFPIFSNAGEDRPFYQRMFRSLVDETLEPDWRCNNSNCYRVAVVLEYHEPGSNEMPCAYFRKDSRLKSITANSPSRFAIITRSPENVNW